jgi:hypothetical protein
MFHAIAGNILMELGVEHIGITISVHAWKSQPLAPRLEVASSDIFRQIALPDEL